MSRFFEGYPWRWVVTDLLSKTTTWAEGLLTNRRIAFVLDDVATIEADVWPDDFRINGLWTDGYPRLAPTNRLVYCFRREAPAGLAPWVCRAAGIIMSPEDQGDPDVPLTHFVAYDAWKFLDARPAVVDTSGNFPGINGWQLFSGLNRGNQIVCTTLKNTISSSGTVRIDAGDGSRIGEGPQYGNWGGTVYYGGHLEQTATIDLLVQRGDSVGDVWRNIVGLANLDIVLTPIYDPVRRPGYTHELNIYNLAGSNRYDAVFGWDRLNHAVTHIDRMHDGTPGSFFNKVWYFTADGFPLPPLAPLTNPASVADFGSWWATQFFPGQTNADPTGAALLSLAQQALTLAKQGKRTTTLSPTPERAPIPFIKYGIGDRVQVYASNRLRVSSDGLQRVQAIPVAISDDGIETISGLICSPDYRGEPS